MKRTIRPVRARCATLLALTACVFCAACRERSSAQGGPVKPKVAAILMQHDQFFRLNELGMKAAADRLGVDLRAQNAAGALDKELALIDTFITQQVAAILVSPLSSSASVPALRRAREAGIHVVTYNNMVAGDVPSSAVASDQADVGGSTGRAVCEFVKTHRAGKARIVLIGFASQLPEQGSARMNGFKAAIRAVEGITIVAEQDAWEAPQATNVVGELLAKSPDIIWGANEGATVGAVTAVRNAGKAGQIAVFGTDVSKQLLDFLLAEDNILQAVTAQKPYEMGEVALETAVKVVNKQPVEKLIVLPGVLFSRNKLDDVRAYQKRLADLAG